MFRTLLRGDGDVTVLLAFTLLRSGRDAEARAEAQAAADANPEFTRVWHVLGLMALKQGRYAEATAAADRCIQAQPRATLCLEVLLESESMQGHCAATLAQARRWIAINPEDRWGYTWLARSLEALGSSRESVDEAVRLANEHQQGTPAMREGLSRLRLSSVAAQRGDFAAADEHIVAFLRLRLAHTELDSDMIIRRVELALEEGDRAGAARLALEQLRLSQAFPAPELPKDPTPLLLAAERSARTITRSELAAAMDEWRRRWRSEHGSESAWELWTMGEAAVVETREDAEAALAVRPPADPPHGLLHQDRVGRVSLLAGRLDEAARLLEGITANCDVLEDPVEMTHALFDLGRTRERQGQVAAACVAYSKVAQRWGKAAPHSVTASEADDALRRLHCPTRDAAGAQ